MGLDVPARSTQGRAPFPSACEQPLAADIVRLARRHGRYDARATERSSRPRSPGSEAPVPGDGNKPIDTNPSLRSDKQWPSDGRRGVPRRDNWRMEYPGALARALSPSGTTTVRSSDALTTCTFTPCQPHAGLFATKPCKHVCKTSTPRPRSDESGNRHAQPEESEEGQQRGCHRDRHDDDRAGDPRALSSGVAGGNLLCSRRRRAASLPGVSARAAGRSLTLAA